MQEKQFLKAISALQKRVVDLYKKLEVLSNVPVPPPPPVFTLPYKMYAAILNQTGQTDPVDTILYNDLSESINWIRQASGVYMCTADSGTFKDNKTGVLINNVEPNYVPLSGKHITSNVNASYSILVTTGLPQQDGGLGGSDDVLYKTYIEIKVFNN